LESKLLLQQEIRHKFERLRNRLVLRSEDLTGRNKIAIVSQSLTNVSQQTEQLVHEFIFLIQLKSSLKELMNRIF